MKTENLQVLKVKIKMKIKISSLLSFSNNFIEQYFKNTKKPQYFFSVF